MKQIKQIYAYETEPEMSQAVATVSTLTPTFEKYQALLMSDYQLNDLPKAIVWSSAEILTTIVSSNKIPAFTRAETIYLCPDREHWLTVFSDQIKGLDLPEVTNYYQKNIEQQLLELLCHELTHHIDLFPSDFSEYEDIWFEEGMCFYLPRRLLLDKQGFAEITAVETKMYLALKNKYGHHSLLDFGQDSYEEDIPSVMFDYWRSFLSVKALVDLYDGDVHRVLEKYNRWYPNRKQQGFSEYFAVPEIADLLP